MSELRKVAYLPASTIEQATLARLVAASSQVCAITGVAAKTFAADMDAMDHVPPEVGEMYEQMANVFLNLADQVRLKQRRI